MCALVRLGCYNKISQTRWLINRNLSPTVLKAGKYKIKVPTDVVSGGLASWFTDGSFLTVSSCAKRDKGAL